MFSDIEVIKMDQNYKENDIILKEATDVIVKDENDRITEELMNKILGENVAVTIGNYIFIPPLESPVVSSPERVYSVMNQENCHQNYVHTNLNVDGRDITLFTHISRIVHEGQPPSVYVHDIRCFNLENLKIAFKNEFPDIFVKTLNIYTSEINRNFLKDTSNVHENKNIG